MKIEMCESLFYSWLRHVKGCQLVQPNWKPSPTWTVENREEAEKLMKATDTYFQKKYGYEIYKSNSFSQLILQAESDLVGICTNKGSAYVYSVETAFHEGGLNYGGTEETVTMIIKKFVRSALCAAGYFNVLEGEIIFASPKIHNGVINDLINCTEELNRLFAENGFGFSARIIANEDFKNEVLVPVMEVSGRINDTSELFMRSWQLISLYEQRSKKTFINKSSEISTSISENCVEQSNSNSQTTYSMINFYTYLTKKNYAENTKGAYTDYVKKVAEWENIDLKTLAEQIDVIRPKYDKGGIYQDKGQIGHATVINALKRFSEYVDSTKI